MNVEAQLTGRGVQFTGTAFNVPESSTLQKECPAGWANNMAAHRVSGSPTREKVVLHHSTNLGSELDPGSPSAKLYCFTRVMGAFRPLTCNSSHNEPPPHLDAQAQVELLQELALRVRDVKHEPAHSKGRMEG